MSGFKRYRRRAETPVIAVQIDLQTDGLIYQKWGGQQRAHAGDWLVNNGGEVYTIAKDTFAKTYKQVSQGLYVKSQPVWARRAIEAGRIQTLEGETSYEAGDMLVFNDRDERDGYAMTSETFDRLYEPDE